LNSSPPDLKNRFVITIIRAGSNSSQRTTDNVGAGCWVVGWLGVLAVGYWMLVAGPRSTAQTAHGVLGLG